MASLVAEEIIETAEECYSLGLITEERLAYVTQRALTQPGYNPIDDLPFSWQIDHARDLSRRAARRRRPFWRFW